MLCSEASAVSEQPEAKMDTDLELLWSRCRAFMVLTAGVLPRAGLPASPSAALACHSFPSAASSALMVSAAGVLPGQGLPKVPRLPGVPADFGTSSCGCIADGAPQIPLMLCTAGVLPMPERLSAGLCWAALPANGASALPAAHGASLLPDMPRRG